MKKYFVLMNVDNNKYWNGLYCDIPYSCDIMVAKRFDTEEQVADEISTCVAFYDVSMIVVKVVYA